MRLYFSRFGHLDRTWYLSISFTYNHIYTRLYRYFNSFNDRFPPNRTPLALILRSLSIEQRASCLIIMTSNDMNLYPYDMNLLASAPKTTKVQLHQQVCDKFSKHLADNNAEGWFRLAIIPQIISLEKKLHRLRRIIIPQQLLLLLTKNH